MSIWRHRDESGGSTGAVADAPELTRGEYELFRRLVYEQSGINLGSTKMQLVRARLGRRMREGQFRSYRAYFEHVKNDPSGRELSDLIDAISTNTTHLFRERQHFEFLTRAIKQWLADRAWCAAHRELRIWSAACSSGDEPYSIAMTAHDAASTGAKLGLKILATDISTRMLDAARAGIYEPERLETVPESYRRRYVTRATVDGQARMKMSPELRRLITFARLNLVKDQFPFRHKFDVIFCRNVMIYFDKATQETVVNKMARHLAPGGYLLIGHSESLNSITHPLTYVQPTIYRGPL